MSELNGLPIPDDEKNNLKSLFELLRKNNNELDIEVVGGARDKSWPRKDIDVTVATDECVGNTELEKAESGLDNLSKFVEKAISGSKFKISKKNQPYTDHEFDNEDILAHGGSLEIQPEKGTPIELIPKKK